MRLFCEAEYEDQAQHYAAVLGSRGINLGIETVEKINSRFLRLNPELALCTDAQGLWLCANGMKSRRVQQEWPFFFII